MERLAGKICIVTGAASAGGIGQASARRMHAEGATVVLADIAEERAREVAADLGERASAVGFDAADVDSIRSLIQTVVDRHGRIDVLYNNANPSGPEWMARDLAVADIDIDYFDESLAVTLRSYFAACKFAIPHMLEQGGGAIIQASSLQAVGGHVRGTAYAIGKAGVNTLTQYVATQYGRRGIRCNSIVIGVIMTETRRRSGAPLTAAAQPHVLTPRLGEPEDIAALAAFLASDDAAFVNGQLIYCDGGFMAHLPHAGELLRQMEEA